MQLTGLAGQIVGWAVLVTAYAIVILGLFCAWSWLLFDVIIKRVFLWLKVYETFAAFIWSYRRNKNNSSTSPDPQ